MIRHQRFLLFFVLLLPLRGWSQSAEVGLFLGTTTYKGEINRSLFAPRLLKPAVGVLYRKNINNHWAHRLGLTYGTAAGDDALSDDDYQKRRNLSFRTRIWDLHYYIEFNFFPYQVANQQTFFTPFIFTGLNGFFFNPQAEINGSWYNLQPLGTEGQGTYLSNKGRYKRIQFGIPFGGGVKFRLTRRFGMTIEAGARKLFTDYLDDVSTTYADKDVLQATYGELSVLLSDRSIDGQAAGNTGRQRGNASDRDWYMFTGITINYTISKKYGDRCTPFKGKLR